MSIAALTQPQHPVLAAASAIDAALDEVAAVDPGWMDPGEKAEALVALTRRLGRLTALQLRVLACSDDVAAESGARSAGMWLDTRVRLGHAEARRSDRLADALALTCRQVATALGEGVVTEAQAAVIVDAVEELPDSAGWALRERAEAHLIGLAADFAPAELRRQGRHVLEVVAPDSVDAAEHAALLAAERRARAATRLSLRSLPDGTAQLSARIPELAAARLRTYLDALASPRQTSMHEEPTGDPGAVVDAAAAGAGAGAGQAPAGPRRRGEAFCALLERVATDQLPEHGGAATTVTVLIDHDQLASAVGVGSLASGERLTAGEVRRLACEARIVPAVLGGASEVLDLGRARRLFSPAQRKAMVIRDRRCRAEGCTIPAAWCEAHHATTPWSRGGKTDLADGLLLCSWHHHRAHDPDYDQRRLPDGGLRFTRRT